jgi:site-specific recombinase XerD
MFEEHLGEQKPVFAITRQDVQGFKRALAEAPARYALRFRGLTFPEAIAANKKRKTPFSSYNPKTINDGHLSKLRSFLNWCVDNDIIPDNPAAGVKVETVKETAPPKVNFSPDDLSCLFGDHFKDEDLEARWAMLISLFTGLRVSELAQVKLDSVRTERNVLVIVIEEKTKNIGSQRIVPVHSKLIEFGFEVRVAELRKRKESQLFPVWYRDGVEAKKKEGRSANPRCSISITLVFYLVGST